MSEESVSDYLVRAEEHDDVYRGVRASSEEFKVEQHDRNDSVFALLAKVFEKFSGPKRVLN
jgi:hypothetical protein